MFFYCFLLTYNIFFFDKFILMFPEIFVFLFMLCMLLYTIYISSKYNKFRYSLNFFTLSKNSIFWYKSSSVRRLSLNFFNKSLSHKFLWNFFILSIFLFICYFFYLVGLFYFNFSGFLCIFDFFIIDFYSQFSKLFLCFIYLFILFFFLFLNFESNKIDFFFLLFCSFVLSLFLMSVFDFLIMYFLIEAITFIACFLILCNNTCLFSVENSIKYFLISSISSGFLGFGISWFYFFTKSTKFLEFIKLMFFCSEFSYIFLPVQLIFIAIIIKLGVAPFYFWLPNVYGNINFFLFFYFVTFIKTVYSFLIIRLIFQLFLNYIYFLKFILSFFIVFSFIIGSIGALEQKKIQYFFVYSSLSQFSFFLLGLLCFSIEGLVSALFFLIQYVINNCIFFSIIFALQFKVKKKISNLMQLKGLSIFYFFEALMLTILLFSFIGLPPFIGFIAKFNILVYASNAQLFFEILVALVCNSLSAYYYLNIIKYIWFDKINKNWWLSYSNFYLENNSIDFFVDSTNLWSSYSDLLLTIRAIFRKCIYTCYLSIKFSWDRTNKGTFEPTKPPIEKRYKKSRVKEYKRSLLLESDCTENNFFNIKSLNIFNSKFNSYTWFFTPKTKNMFDHVPVNWWFLFQTSFYFHKLQQINPCIFFINHIRKNNNFPIRLININFFKKMIIPVNKLFYLKKNFFFIFFLLGLFFNCSVFWFYDMFLLLEVIVLNSFTNSFEEEFSVVAPEIPFYCNSFEESFSDIFWDYLVFLLYYLSPLIVGVFFLIKIILYTIISPFFFIYERLSYFLWG